MLKMHSAMGQPINGGRGLRLLFFIVVVCVVVVVAFKDVTAIWIVFIVWHNINILHEKCIGN